MTAALVVKISFILLFERDNVRQKQYEKDKNMAEIQISKHFHKKY